MRAHEYRRLLKQRYIIDAKYIFTRKMTLSLAAKTLESLMASVPTQSNKLIVVTTTDNTYYAPEIPSTVTDEQLTAIYYYDRRVRIAYILRVTL